MSRHGPPVVRQTPDTEVDALAIRRARLLLGLTFCLMMTISLVLVAGLALSAESLGDGVEEMGRPAGAVILVVLGTILVVVLAPAALVAGAAGYLLPWPVALPVALLAVTAGTMVSWSLGRRISSPATRRVAGVRVEQSMQWLERRSLRTVLITRLTPGSPLGLASYLFGIVGFRARDVGWGTALGYVPRCAAYVVAGGAIQDFDDPANRIALIVSVLMIVLLAAVPRLLRLRKHAEP